MKHKPTRQGLISTLILILVALVLLGYFKINVQTVVSSPIAQQNLHYAWELILQGIAKIWYFIETNVQSALPS